MSALETVMVTRVVIVRACAVVGDTVMVHRRPAVVVDLLPRGSAVVPRLPVTDDLPCRDSKRSLHYEALRWRCPGCRVIYTPAALAAVR